MVTITEKAATKIKEVMAQEKRNGTALRLLVAGGGCSGFKYGMNFDEAKEGDQVLEQHGLKVLVDPSSHKLLKDITVDWVEDVTGAGFKIENPNAGHSCGCGQSFEAKA